MRIKSKCLVCQGVGSKKVDGVAHECLGCRGYGFVWVNTVSTPTPEEARQQLNIRMPSSGLTEKIIKAVEEFQSKYFQTLDIYDLRPMRLQDIANMLNSNPSTICLHLRQQKIQGVDARWLFSDKVSGVSSRVIKQMIVELMSPPVTDVELMELLKAKGITISRRTVTKYRNLCGIPARLKKHKT